MSVKSIYFGLFHTLGDIIASTSIIHAVKTKYPESKITYATSQEYVDVLKDNPEIDEVIPCGHPYEVVLRSCDKQYDKIMLPLQLTQADSVWHQTPDYCVENGENHNLVDFYAKRCDDDIVVSERKTFIYPKQEHWDQIVANVSEPLRDKFNNTPFITMHVTSRNPSKDWPIEKFKELAHAIHSKYGDKIVIYQIGGPNDPDIDNSVVNSLKGIPILNTAAAIQRSLFHIDIDSGPSFIADSLNIPTICIMGATNQNIAGPIGPNVTFIEPDFRECIGTVTHCACATKCLINKPCINTIEVNTVFNKFCELFESKYAELTQRTAK